MKRFIVKVITLAMLGAALALPLASPAFAASPGTQGQPGQTCLSSTAPSEPGNASSAPGSAFNETGPGTAGTVYAGNGVSATTANSANAVSQYDVACFQVSQPHP
jgi:hypothetical protein